MSLLALSRGLVIVPLAGLVYLTVRHYAALPDTVASHFGIDGMPDGYMKKKSFFVFALATMAGLTLLLMGVAFVVGAVVNGSQDPPINLINKAHWLAPERKEATASFLAAWMSWMCTAVLLLMLDTFRQAIQINLGSRKTMSFRGLLALLVFLLAWIVIVFVRFGRA